MNDVARARGEGPVGRTNGACAHRGRSAGRLGNPRLRAAIRRSVAERAARLPAANGRCIAAIGRRAIRTRFMRPRRLHGGLLRRLLRTSLRRRRGGTHVLRLGILVTLRRGRVLLSGGRGVLSPRRTVGFVAFAAFLFALDRFGLLGMHEHRGDSQEAAENSVSDNCSRYIHEIRPYLIKVELFTHTDPLYLGGRACGEQLAVEKTRRRKLSDPTNSTHSGSWDLNSSWDRRIFPGKSVPSGRFRSTGGRCSRGRSRGF